MKKILYSIVITVFLSANIHAQTPGVWGIVNNPAGLDPRISDMIFATDTIGYIFGSFSASSEDMQVTVDSGVDFSPVKIQTTPTLHSPSFVSNMAWPTAQNGYIAADTGHSYFFLSTANGGSSWTASSISPLLQFANIYFPTANVGYATGSLSDGSGTNFIAKTTNAGATWDSIYGSSNYSFGKLYFMDENNGMIFTENESNQLLLAYTTNGGTSFTLRPVPTFAPPNFLHWNKDSSWIVGADSVYRSVDSGKNWTTVILYDSAAGPATVGAFFGDTGFVFLGIEPIVLMTTNSGISWTSSRLPNSIGGSGDSVTPLAASMPSQYDCYLLAYDNNATADVMMKIAFAKPIDTSGGGSGVVQTDVVPTIPFAAISESNAVLLTMAPASEIRNLNILDVLGRTCMSISLVPSADRYAIANDWLRTGTYFAQLGTSIVKFAIP